MTQPRRPDKADHTRFLITILAMVVIAALSIFAVARELRVQSDDREMLRDGVECILESLGDPQIDAATECERFRTSS